MANFSLFVFIEYELSTADVLNDIIHCPYARVFKSQDWLT
jgi:hypothetical protein